MAHLRCLRFVHSYLDRHGHPRHYFRREGRQIPLPGPFGSEDFMRAYQTALAGLPAAVKAEIASFKVPGTIDALVVSYYRCEAWLALDEETRKTRRRVIEKFRERNGGKLVATLRSGNVVNMLAEIEGASAKRSWFKAIRPLLKHAVPTMLREDPTAGIPTPKLPKTKGHHPWTDRQIEQYRGYWRCGTQQRLVMEFALEAVSRRGEVVRLGPQHLYAGEDGEAWIHIARIHGSDDVDIPVTPDLMAAINAMPGNVPDGNVTNLTFITTAYGKPRSKFGLGTDFAKWAREAGLPDHCRLHGLKKAGMRRGAEDGMTTHELMNQSGHKALAEVERYTKGADQKKLAKQGMAKRRGAQKENSQLANLDAGLAILPFKPLKS